MFLTRNIRTSIWPQAGLMTGRLFLVVNGEFVYGGRVNVQQMPDTGDEMDALSFWFVPDAN